MALKSDEITRLNKIFRLDMTDEEIETLGESFFLYIKQPDLRVRAIKKAFDNFCKKQKNNSVEISFYKREVEFLKNIPDDKTRRIFYALMIAKKTHYHQSGWIRFDIEEMREFCDDEEMSLYDFFDAVEFGLDMRVSGSKEAVTTFLDVDMLIYGYTASFYDDEICFVCNVGDVSLSYHEKICP